MQPITIQVFYDGAFPTALVEHLEAHYDVTIERKSPLIIRTGDFNVLGAITRLAGEGGATVTAIKYRRASVFELLSAAVA